MTKPSNLAAIEKATSLSWDDWLTFFASIGAKDLPHHEIAAKAYDHIVSLGVFDDAGANAEGRQNPFGWWSQSVTVAYEQHIGRRRPGQRSDGTYEVSASKTVDGDMEDAMSWWLDKTVSQADFNGVKIDGEAKTSSTEKWRTWRLKLADGTRLLASANDKPAGKALFVITHQKLRSSRDAETWRTFWKQFLNS